MGRLLAADEHSKHSTGSNNCKRSRSTAVASLPSNDFKLESPGRDPGRSCEHDPDSQSSLI